MRVERTGEVSLLSPVLSPTHVLAAHPQPHSLALAALGPGALPCHHLHTQGVGVRIVEPVRVRSFFVTDLQILPHFSVLLNLEVAGGTVEVERGDLYGSNGTIISDIIISPPA